MIGDISDPRVADAVGSLFGNAASNIRENVNESFDVEEQGERASREDTYTDDIVREMRRGINNWLEEFSGRFRESGVNVNIEFSSMQMPVG